MFAGVICVLYCLTYGWTRSHCILIHRVSVETGGGGSKHYYHGVRGGDLGPIVILQKPDVADRQHAFVEVCYRTFTPLRWTEALVWHFIPIDGN
ncbi:hypothetical protein Cflav_PD1618 [Pedosphaera parvula Ellin514]|uniref:Uncharacterized protein n=2 Tax=Pedosphaera TaxID=1032526 RepID=B9XLZ8_PEDPL|nr:hypothetical protein Cflav_PD1618 [Pedosphaera parvula Ellin514]